MQSFVFFKIRFLFTVIPAELKQIHSQIISIKASFPWWEIMDVGLYS